MKTLMTAVNHYDFLEAYTLMGKTIICVRDFLGFTESWDEISNPNIDWEIVRLVEDLAEELGVEVEYSSRDI